MSSDTSWVSIKAGAWDEANFTWDDINGTSPYVLSNITWDGIQWLTLQSTWTLYNAGPTPSWALENSSSSTYTASPQSQNINTNWEV